MYKVSQLFIPKTAKSLYILLLAINGVAFFIELLLLSKSDSVSVLSELFHVFYHCLLYIVGLILLNYTEALKHKVALVLGGFQILFGLIVCWRSIFHAFTPHHPHHLYVAGVGVLALITTYVPYVLISHFKKKDIYISSCCICLRNDFLFKFSFFIVALATYYFGSKAPDIILGLLQAFLLIQAGWFILYKVKSSHGLLH